MASGCTHRAVVFADNPQRPRETLRTMLVRSDSGEVRHLRRIIIESTGLADPAPSEAVLNILVCISGDRYR